MFTITARWIVLAAGIVLLPTQAGAQDSQTPQESENLGEPAARQSSPNSEPDQSDRGKLVGSSSAEGELGLEAKPWGKPDLIVKTGGCGGWCPFLTLYVENVGFGPSTETSISIKCKDLKRDGQNECANIPSSVTIHDLPAKQSSDQNFQAVTQIPHFVDLTAKVDPYYKVDESNEYNNTWTSESIYPTSQE